MTSIPATRREPSRTRASNLRTALVLVSIALTFFVGVIATHFIGDPAVGMSLVGFAVFVFLSFAIGRHLRRGR